VLVRLCLLGGQGGEGVDEGIEERILTVASASEVGDFHSSRGVLSDAFA
jgi:hypothetical protein